MGGIVHQSGLRLARARAGLLWLGPDVLDDPVAAHDQGGAGLRRQFACALRSPKQSLPRPTQNRRVGLLDGFVVHRSLQSRSSGVSPELSYKAQASTAGA